MKIFDPKECTKKPRADMFLPVWLLVCGILSGVFALFFLVATLGIQEWAFLVGIFLFGGLGAAALLCWKNQTIHIIDEETFEYTTFLGKKTLYRFTEIKKLRQNGDSLTLFVGDGKIHIESSVVISCELMDKIDAALERSQYADNT